MVWGIVVDIADKAERAVDIRTRLLTRLERRGRPAYVSAYLKYVMTLRPRIGHPWGGALRAGASCSGPSER